MKKDNELTNDEKNKRRFYLVLPLLVMPFITILFVLFGGGKGHGKGKGLADQAPGINKMLPGANLDERPLGKLAYYDRAANDSAKLKGSQSYDTWNAEDRWKFSGSADTPYTATEFKHGPNASFIPNTMEDDYGEAKAREIQKKLDALNETLMEQEKQPHNPPEESPLASENSVDTELKKMEAVVQQLKDSDSENEGSEDPQMAQLGGMLQTILDIQHPGVVEERLKKNSTANRGRIYAVQAQDKRIPVTGLWPDTLKTAYSIGTGFYSASASIDQHPDMGASGIEAVVYRDQTVVNGSVVKLQLVQPVYINGIRIAANQFVYGVAKLAGERLEIQISSIRYDEHLLPIDLSAYDYDGLSGVYIPGSLSRDVAKESSDQAIQGLGLASLDPSLGAQVAGAGIEAAKNLLSKKVKLVKVSLKAGYKVLLKDNKDKGGEL